MKKWKRGVSAAMAAALVFTSIPFFSMTTAEAERTLAATRMKEISLSDSMVSGSDPWNNDESHGVKNVCDGDLTTFFDGVKDGWIQIDLGQAEIISAVSYAPRKDYEERCTGASIYGSEDGKTWELLYTIEGTPVSGTENYVYADSFLSKKNVYRYLKYAVPASTDEHEYNCNLAEIKIYGAEDAADYTCFTGTDGAIWYDDQGKVIQAHGGQVQRITWDYDYNGNNVIDDDEHEFWYWVGEDKTYDYRPCPGIKGYISKDLYNWKDMGNILKTVDSWETFTTDPYFTSLYGSSGVTTESSNYAELFAVYGDIWAPADSSSGCVIERPKMLYNDTTKKYVIWFHADGQLPNSSGSGNYAKAKAGVAVSDSPFGPFRLLGSYLLNYDEHADHGFDNAEGGHVRDMNLFKDNDGTAYVIYSSDGNQTTYIAQLNDTYTGLKEPAINDETKNEYFTRNFIGASREAPAMFRYKDKYFLINSGCSGWVPNQAKYAVADDPLGPWTMVGDPCVGNGSATTFDTQSTCVIPVDPENGKFIYMGDRWRNPDKGQKLRDSRYVWLPIEFTSEEEIVLRPYTDWSLELLDQMRPFTLQTEIPSVVTSKAKLVDALPSEVSILEAGETVPKTLAVTWSGVPETETVLGEVTVTGRLANGRSITRTIRVVDDRMIYFFDAAAEYESDEAAYMTTAKEILVSRLRNTAADQPYTETTHAGYTGTYGTDIGQKSAGNDIWSHGWWAYGGKSIDYAFDLEAGTYTVAAGWQEWWSTARTTAFTVKTSEKTLANESFTLAATDMSLQKDLTFTLEEAATVTVSISKAGGTADPVLSWIAVLQLDRKQTVKEYLEEGIAAYTVSADKKDAYTAASWAVYENILEQAKALLLQTAPEKYEAEDILAALAEAKAQLELKTEAGAGSGSGSGSGQSSGGSSYAPSQGNPSGSDASSKDDAKDDKKDDKKDEPEKEKPTQTVKKTSFQSMKADGGKKLVVTWKEIAGADGYEIQYSLKKGFRSGVKKATTKKTTITVKKLKKGKQYYVRVRAYKIEKVNGKKQKVYGAWSTVKKTDKIR